MLRRTALALLLACTGTAARAADLAPQARSEVDHLLDYLGRSGCQFNRNGTWYEATKARDHLQTKLDYLLKKSLVSTADQFIDRAASESSMSGKPYQVRCGAAAPVPSRDWLRDELARFRARKTP